ncbi:unnamed protein product [Allacma fusca]|uniref:Uncharacterized protein n=1 Tax=Allacma fusca TaxID=39272 RepID=A0A8J2PCM1_9HEXA|nr:unnamed protein product [Allacma fusca]
MQFREEEWSYYYSELLESEHFWIPGIGSIPKALGDTYFYSPRVLETLVSQCRSEGGFIPERFCAVPGKEVRELSVTFFPILSSGFFNVWKWPI